MRFCYLLLLAAVIFTISCIPVEDTSNKPEVPTQTASSVEFYDNDLNRGVVGGNVRVVKALTEKNIQRYCLYWGISDRQRIAGGLIADLTADNSDLSCDISIGTVPPETATHILVYTKNKVGLSKKLVSCPIDDRYLILVESFDSEGDFVSFDPEVLGGRLYFKMETEESGTEVFYLDTNLESGIIKDINTGSGGSLINSMTVYSGRLYFGAYDGSEMGLWRLTASMVTAEQVVLSDYQYFAPQHLTVFNGYIYMSGSGSDSQRELWRYNGTSGARFSLINSLNPADPRSLTVLGSSTMVFSADDGNSGRELWKTNGVSVEIVSDIIAGVCDSDPDDITVFNNKAVFTATTEFYGKEPFVTDGTSAGTFMLKDIRSGVGSSEPLYYTVAGNYIYFSANNGINGRTLWRTDGTYAGTVMISGLNSTGASNPSSLYGGNSSLWFAADDGINGQELWFADNGVSEARLISNIINDNGSFPSSIVEYNGLIYFIARLPSGGRGVYCTDGTADGTKPVAGVNEIMAGRTPVGISLFAGNIVVFYNNNTDCTEIAVYCSNSD